MTVYRHKTKCLRDYLVNADEAARFINVTAFRFRALVEDGLIPKASRKGFYRLGGVIDGHAEAVRRGIIPSPINHRVQLADAA